MGAGYSGTPLPRKLGIREGDVVALVGDPGHAREVLAPLPEGVVASENIQGANIIIAFVTERQALAASIEELGQAIFPNGSCWVAWPKRASQMRTDITEDAVREVALPLGLVDTKVCAIDDTWSGLRLVWRKERRIRAAQAG